MANDKDKYTTRLLLGSIGPLALIFLWEIAHRFSWFNPTLLPSPVDTTLELVKLLASGYFWESLSRSFARFSIGYVGAVIVGSALGIAVGASNRISAVAMPLIDFFRSTPVTVLYPLFVLFFGVGPVSKTAMIFFSCALITTVNSAYGVLLSNPVRASTLRLFGANDLQVFFHVTLREAMPQIFVGARIALGIALIVAILVEMFMGSQRGLGQMVIEAFTTYETAKLFALIIVTGFIGVILNRIFLSIERAVIPWSFADAAGR